MGGTANEIARSLNWYHKEPPVVGKNASQMKNYLYTAEWLHLRAYSWGGHLDTNPMKPSESQGITCQTPFNLVLGTSETNSFMLRNDLSYEKAWQNLFNFEYSFRKDKGIQQPQVNGTLWIGVNSPDNKLGTTWPPNQQVDCVEIDDFDSSNNRFVVRSVNLGETKGQNKTEAEAMKKVAAIFPFIAYVIAYKVSMKTHSYALDGKGLEKAICFHPFRRPFFHRAESMLDKLVINTLKDRARKAYDGKQLDKNGDQTRLTDIPIRGSGKSGGKQGPFQKPGSKSGGSGSQPEGKGGRTPSSSRRRGGEYDQEDVKPGWEGGQQFQHGSTPSEGMMQPPFGAGYGGGYPYGQYGQPFPQKQQQLPPQGYYNPGLQGSTGYGFPQQEEEQQQYNPYQQGQQLHRQQYPYQQG